MKWSVLAIVFILSVISVSASYLPEPQMLFEYKKSNCTNGTLQFDVTHEGISVAYDDLNITVESDELNEIPLKGEWYYPDDYRIPENYTGSDFTSTTRLKFKSTMNMFTKGKYIVDLRWPSNTVYNENIQFAVECKEIECKTNDDCISQQTCASNACEWLKCDETQYAMGHKCFAKCEDNDKCTTDYFIDNQCVHVKIKECEIEDAKVSANANIFTRFWNWLKNLNK